VQGEHAVSEAGKAPAILVPALVRCPDGTHPPSREVRELLEQVDHFGTRWAFAMRTRGASRCVLKTATGFPLCTMRVSSSRRVWSVSTMRWNASQFRAALPVPP